MKLTRILLLTEERVESTVAPSEIMKSIRLRNFKNTALLKELTMYSSERYFFKVQYRKLQ